MPTKNKKGNSKANKKKPVVDAGQRPLVPISVKDCLVWPNPGGEHENMGPQPDQDAQVNNRYFPQKADIGRAKDRGYELPPQQYQEKKDDGTVIEALRGWPGAKKAEEEMGVFGWDSPTMADKHYTMYQDGKPTSGKKSGKGKKGKKGQKQEEGDPFMVDLISHRFLNEAAQRREEEEASRHGEEAEAARPDYKNPKGNRTSQLRAIVGTEKAYPVQKPLWKMPKFEENAKPRISTKRGKEGEKDGVANGYGQGEGYVCTCPQDYDYLQEPRPLTGQTERDYELENLNYSPVHLYDYNP